MMNATFNPQAAAEQARKSYRDVTTQHGQLGLDTSVPEAVRAIAEKTVAQVMFAAADRLFTEPPAPRTRGL